MSLVSNCSSSICLTSGEGSCRGLSLIPGGSSPDASSSDVACRSFSCMSFKCCLGESFCDGFSSFVVFVGFCILSLISCDRKYDRNVSFDIGISS